MSDLTMYREWAYLWRDGNAGLINAINLDLGIQNVIPILRSTYAC